MRYEDKRVWLCRVSKYIGEIILKLKTIKYKIDIICYLFFLLSGLVINPSNQTYWFILIIFEFFYYKVFYYLPNIITLFSF